MTGRGSRCPTIALALAAAILACEPKPKYPPVEQPVVGWILAEASTVATPAAQRIDMAGDPVTKQPRLSTLIPAGAYPVGTRVTVRLVKRLPMVIDACVVLNGVLEYWDADEYLALQVLPANLAPAVPLRVEFNNAIPRWGYVALHARENDSAWTVAGPTELTSTGLAFPIPKPGLWTVTQLILPPSLQGRLQRMEVTCNGQPLVNPPTWFLDLDGDSFALASPIKGSACYDVLTGTASLGCSRSDHAQSSLYLGGTGHVAIAIYDYSLDATGTGLWWTSDLSGDCDSGEEQRDHYVLLPLGTAPPPLPQSSNGRCPIDAGGTPDGG